MNKKAAIELSLNFIVILIISIAIFSFSIYFAKKFFDRAYTIKDEYDERTDEMIDNILRDGSKVAIPMPRAVAQSGGIAKFRLGIINILDKAPQNKFRIAYRFSAAYDKNDNQICPATPSPAYCTNAPTWVKFSVPITSYPLQWFGIDKTVKNNEEVKFLMVVEPKGNPASGIYIYDLNISYENATNQFIQYDSLHKIYVTVP